MSDTELDWRRTVLVSAIAGGVFWALAVFLIAETGGVPLAFITTGVIAVAAVAVGVVGLRSAGSARGRGVAVTAILTPLTGVIAVVVFCIAALIVELITRVAS
ncbi:hypothetical protein [[Mycobacterium] wendilense]|uniref:DUF4190 domain-containing protein n=1 Tax=[Mycobacterium] wendilense TaxID=3064284 RepID=A0ABM9MIF3_9MYCO|nr:hypothetical protein [Mycolicibacterium sp. MU0050]CAJ1585983.1 hypothetical protein MU0050_004021 [Mycolicibacterium sp. MU0050]